MTIYYPFYYEFFIGQKSIFNQYFDHNFVRFTIYELKRVYLESGDRYSSETIDTLAKISLFQFFNFFSLIVAYKKLAKKLKFYNFVNSTNYELKRLYLESEDKNRLE